MNDDLLNIADPVDFFTGQGRGQLPSPTDILLFLRTSKERLQQKALQNRTHHRFVLIFNLETEGHVHANNLTLPFKPGQALLILPYQFHHFSQLKAGQLKWLFCTFDLEPRTFLEPLRNRVIDIGETTESALESVLKRWHQPATELQTEQLQTTLLHLLLSLKEDRQQTATDLPPEPTDNLLRAVNRLMAEWRGQTIVVADLAKALGLSESRLRVLFKEAAGIPLGQYIQNYRLNRAMALLRTTALPIAEIAEEAGFGSPQAFSRLFKNETGHSPRQHRNTTPNTPIIFKNSGSSV